MLIACCLALVIRWRAGFPSLDLGSVHGGGTAASPQLTTRPGLARPYPPTCSLALSLSLALSRVRALSRSLSRVLSLYPGPSTHLPIQAGIIPRSRHQAVFLNDLLLITGGCRVQRLRHQFDSPFFARFHHRRLHSAGPGALLRE